MGSILSTLMPEDLCTPNFARQVKGHIIADKSNIARLNAKIQDLRRLREREPAAPRPLIAPIHKLPVELLTEIFLLVLGSREDWLAQALVVSQVCAHWRRVACATPQLWNGEIALNLTKPRSDVYLATTKTLFERSAPLSISVLLENEPVEASPLVDYLYSLAPRWKALTWTQSTSSRLSALPRGVLNNLESVFLLDCTDLPVSSPTDAFLGAQRLRVAALDLRGLGCFRMPWSQLTLVSLTGDGVPSSPAQLFLDILVQCTAAVEVHFSRMMPWTEAPTSSAPIIRLPRLANLELIFGPGGKNITPFFTRLALPALTYLSIYAAIGTSWSSADFTQFQRRSPNVHELLLCGPSLTSDRAVSLLTEYPHLTCINLQFVFRRGGPLNLSSVLDWLTYRDTASAVNAPRLRRLVIMDPRLNDIEEAVWEEMIFSRWWPDAQLANHTGARLETLVLARGRDLLHQFSASFVEKMDQLRTAGLNVMIL
ncbi:hypothetical protein FB45DRAFT_1053296 [Roridomyces roridus]|uniref:F-box domain-containing protein n=1 Tax=Roridomyces roridus TaxID=1738132 RepID=A0AAD7FYF6_9AGAR|nr:hypothetical protein FB45DRAFT_1053296 [Roridomyces roridus]